MVQMLLEPPKPRRSLPRPASASPRAEASAPEAPSPPPVLPAVARGDEAAMSECLGRFGPLVWSMARSMLAQRESAEDAVQDIFIDVWRSAERFDPALGSEATFVATIARRRLIDRRRAAARRPQASPLAEDVVDEGVAARFERVEVGEEAARAAHALRSLRPTPRKVLGLHLFDGLTHSQIAQLTGLPLGTIKSHLRRGLERVRRKLAERGAPLRARAADATD